MTVVVVAEIDGGTQEQYDAVSAQAMEGDQLPDGCQAHIAGPTESGWRVITAWDSEEQFHAFRNERLIPALASGGFEAAPEIKVDSVHKLITA